ncbi:MAG: ABC transporter permease [Candidatus Pacebacteria bacterium]|nr:ABC transporter permease [Candidatus Paceibacterota bacterium]
MIITKAKRVIKGGFINFWRNGWVSLAAILIVVITLFTIGSIVFSRAIMGAMLAHVQDKVDITVYFKTDADEAEITAVKDAVSKLDEVKSVEYISAAQALEEFKTRHKDNATIMQSLDELDGNPLGAALNIKTKEVSQYGSVAKFLEGKSGPLGDSSIDKVNYYQNKKVIDRLITIMDSAKNIGLAVSLILVFISMLITFNTIRLAIYSSREEVEVMKLVGASNRFASGPFVVEGMMYGFFSAIIAMILFYPFALWLDPKIVNFFSGVSLREYYIANFGQIFILLLGIGILTCALSSLIAIRRYLKI